MSHTKDERFIIKLYELALSKGDVGTPCPKYIVGQLSGLTAKGVDAVCKLLVQANFVKGAGGDDIYLTPHGEKLAKRLLEEI